MSKEERKIIVILGPTSSGKSDIAVKMAKKFKGEIISADSRQIYRGMDIGTGKIPRDKKLSFGELRATARKEKSLALKERGIYMSHDIPHHMIDIVSPRTDFNVAKFKKQAEKIISDILKRGKLPIICGGTGFWISAVVDNVNFPEVKPDWKLRKKLDEYPAEKLFSMLKKLDSTRAKNIDPKNKVRLIRAIEICKKIKKVPAFAGIPSTVEGSRRNNKYSFLQIGIKLSKEKLHQNIEKRVKQRFKQGMIKEVENLHKVGLSWKKIQSFGLAYFWIPLYLQKKLSKSLALRNSKSLALGREKPSFGQKSLALEKRLLTEKVIQAEKNYAKRQMAWFRRDKRINWLDTYTNIQKMVAIFLK